MFKLVQWAIQLSVMFNSIFMKDRGGLHSSLHVRNEDPSVFMFLSLGLYVVKEKVHILKEGIYGNGRLVPKSIYYPQR
jgi:hypothetical protein